jgi:hypothetical protein
MSNERRVKPSLCAFTSLPRLISSTASDSTLFSMSAVGRMSSSALTRNPPSEYMSVKLRLPP